MGTRSASKSADRVAQRSRMPSSQPQSPISRNRQATSSDKGAAAVEFAIIAPILVALVFGAIQYGWYFFQRQQVEFAAREGARQVAVGQADLDCAALASDIKTKVSAPASQVTVTISYSYVPVEDEGSRDISVGDQGLVTVSTPIQLNLGLPLGTSTATTTATTRIEKPLTTNSSGCTQ